MSIQFTNERYLPDDSSAALATLETKMMSTNQRDLDGSPIHLPSWI
jgi:hypothetical protein